MFRESKQDGYTFNQVWCLLYGMKFLPPEPKSVYIFKKKKKKRPTFPKRGHKGISCTLFTFKVSLNKRQNGRIS